MQWRKLIFFLGNQLYEAFALRKNHTRANNRMLWNLCEFIVISSGFSRQTCQIFFFSILLVRTSCFTLALWSDSVLLTFLFHSAVTIMVDYIRMLKSLLNGPFVVVVAIVWAGSVHFKSLLLFGKAKDNIKEKNVGILLQPCLCACSCVSRQFFPSSQFMSCCYRWHCSFISTFRAKSSIVANGQLSVL